MPGTTPANHGNDCTPQEVRRLEKVAKGDTPTRLIAHELGRPEQAVRSKASEEDISLKLVNQSPYNRRQD